MFKLQIQHLSAFTILNYINDAFYHISIKPLQPHYKNKILKINKSFIKKNKL